MRILLTGASGGVGASIVEFLAKEARVSLIPLFWPCTDEGAENLRRIGGIGVDLRSTDINSVLHGAVEAVVHCAARIPGPGADEETCARENRRIDSNVFEYCAAAAVPAIYMSTASVYARRNDGTWLDEESPVEPAGAYAAAKLESERLFRSLPDPGAVIFRLTSPYGPFQRQENVIGRFCRAALRGERLGVWGSGGREQDFVHMKDIARAALLALDQPEVPTGVYVIGSGAPVTMAELARTVADQAGLPLAPLIGPHEDPEEGRTARFRLECARKRLGWVPRVALAEGIAGCLKAWADRDGRP